MYNNTNEELNKILKETGFKGDLPETLCNDMEQSITPFKRAFESGMSYVDGFWQGKINGTVCIFDELDIQGKYNAY